MDAHSTISENTLHWSFDFTESRSLVCKMFVCYEPLRFALQSKWKNTYNMSTWSLRGGQRKTKETHRTGNCVLMAACSMGPDHLLLLLFFEC